MGARSGGEDTPAHPTEGGGRRKKRGSERAQENSDFCVLSRRAGLASHS